MHDENRGLRLIAKKLGISLTAVSRAIRNENDIGYDLKEKVWEEALKASYQSPTVKKRVANRNHLVVFAGSTEEYRPDLAARFAENERRLIVMPLGEVLDIYDIEDIFRMGAEAVITCRPLDHKATLLSTLYELPIYRNEDIGDVYAFIEAYKAEHKKED